MEERAGKDLRNSPIYRDESGAVVVLVAILLPVLLGLAAFAVDVGYIMVTKNELQNVADAAALAGARTLGRLYECNGDIVTCPGKMPYQNQLIYEPDAEVITNAITGVASQNRAGGTSGITINSADIVIGTWDGVTKSLTASLASPDAVRVTARKDATANGPMSTFFAKALGTNAVNLSASATAALTGESTAGPGGLPIPVGISRKWFELPRDTYCNQNIKFYPTGTMEGCSGWHTYDDRPASASRLKKLLADLTSGAFTSPATTAYSTVFEFTGGTIASAFDNMKALFEHMKTRDNDDNPATWTCTVPVYDRADCSNPNEPLRIVGFTTVVIHTVLDSPEKTIVAKVKCDNIESGRGGGGNFGTKGSIPGLVQ